MPLSLHSVMLIKVEIYSQVMCISACWNWTESQLREVHNITDAEISILWLIDPYVFVYLVKWMMEKNEK